MLILSLLLIGLCVLGEFIVEAVLKIEFEDAVIVEIDKKYFDTDKSAFYVVEDEETGETTLSSTLIMVKELPAEVEARFTLTGLSMGKFTVPTGIDVKMLFCEMFDEPIIMGPFLTGLGFPQDSCPPEPGEYSQEGYKLTVDNLPDEFPENKYLFLLDVFLKNKSYFTIKIYVNVEME